MMENTKVENEINWEKMREVVKNESGGKWENLWKLREFVENEKWEQLSKIREVVKNERGFENWEFVLRQVAFTISSTICFYDCHFILIHVQCFVGDFIVLFLN